MKTQAIISIIGVVAMALVSGHAMAGSVAAAQRSVIAAGVASGTYTVSETVGLVKQQQAISRTINRATSDGTVTAAEAANIKGAQASANYWLKAYSENAWTRANAK